MRKFISLAAAMRAARFQDLSAQPCGPVTMAIEERFNRDFKDASHVRWVKIKDIFQVRFYNHLECCLAFFTPSGQMLMRGRKIPLDFVPAVVVKEMERIRNASERKHDLLAVAGVYELNDAQGTRYFINLESESLSMSILVDGNGQCEIVKKVNNQLPVTRYRLPEAVGAGDLEVNLAGNHRPAMG